MLGANDSTTGARTSTATYLSNLTAITGDLVAAGYRVLLNSPTYTVPGSGSGVYDETSIALAQSYAAQLLTLANGATIRKGDQAALSYFADHTNELNSGLHPSNTGAISLGGMWTAAYQNAGMNVPIGSATTINVSNIDSAAATVSGVVASVFSKTTAGTPAKRLFSLGRAGDEASSTLTFSAATAGACTATIPIPAGVGGINTGDALLVYFEKDPESTGFKTELCPALAA